jgi:putative ABC transport system substrate-binding protein
MNRRQCALRLAALMCSLAAARKSDAQSTALRRVGVLAPSTRQKEEVTLAPFFAEMRGLDWREGENIRYEWAVGDDHDDRMAQRAAEVTARRPELIYAPPQIAALAAKNAASTIPVVFAVATDPVGVGLVSDLAHPGGNVTGVASITSSLAPKRLELLREALPGAKRIGVIADTNDSGSRVDVAALTPAAATLCLTLVVESGSTPDEFDAALRRLVEARVDAILPTVAVLTGNLRQEMVDSATRAKIPLIGHRAYTAAAGGLMSYGPSLDDQLARSAHLVDKILRGAKPADIPVEQPTKFELVVNLKAARVLGVAVPQPILLRADRIIE